MQDRIKNYFTGLLEKWKALEPKVKITIAGISVAVVLALAFTIYLTVRPNMVTIFKDLDLDTAYEMKAVLEEKNINHRVINNGTAIEVNARDATNAKMELASAGIPKSGFTYTDALNASGLGTTSDTRRENMVRVKQTELEQAISNFYDVKNATVQLVLRSDDNFFLEAQQEASASVILDLRNELSKSQIMGIARFVATSVDGLNLDNINIVDNNATPLYGGDINGLDYFSSQYDLEMLRKNEIENKARDILSQMYDDVKIISQISLYWDKYSESNEIYSTPIEDATRGVPSREVAESSNVTGYTDGAEPGVAANNAQVNQYDIGGNQVGEAEVERSETDYLYNRTVSSLERNTGSINFEESSLTITVYNDRYYDETALMAQGVLNDTNTWQDYKTQIRNTVVPIDIPEGLDEALMRGTNIQNLSVVGFERPIFIDREIVTRPIDQYIAVFILVVLIGLLAFGLIRRTQPADITEVEPELSVEELLVSSQEDTLGGEEGMEEIDFTADSDVKRQIDKFIDERPDAVAQLLRNWLNEDWE